MTSLPAMALGLAVGGGCSIAGSWRLVETKPTGAPFPVSGITFDSAGRYEAMGLYTAEGSYDGDVHTTSGTFTRKPGRLSLEVDDRPAMVYRIHRRWDGKLVMTFKVPGGKRKVTAVLARTEGRSSP